ncbi:MAG: glutamate--tRNA ligase [Armatimonadetes bacterium]|nr:glutamate--tRNA ligase [Armatimonadota bacterium]
MICTQHELRSGPTSGAVRVRYPPSPTGAQHIGNVRTAILNWLFAKKMGGRFIVRLEDTDRDPSRYRADVIPDILSNLRYLGIEPDEDWEKGGPAGPYIQSERLYLYQNAARELIESGKAYRCYCTPERIAALRAEQQQRGEPTGYDRHCRYLSDSELEKLKAQPFVVRLAVPLEGQTLYHDEVHGDISVENSALDDQVLLKSNGWPTYHLANVVDDHSMGITHVIRGEDWLPSTPKHVLLYQAFGWETPKWTHAPLILGTDHKKLSKRHGDTEFAEYIRKGYLPEALMNFLALLGWSSGEDRELYSVEELIDRFSLEGITPHPAIFDANKLIWMNGEYIRKSSPETIIELSIPYLRKSGLIKTEEDVELAKRVIPLVTDRMKTLDEVVSLTDFFFGDMPKYDPKAVEKWLNSSDSKTILAKILPRLKGIAEEPFTVHLIEAAVRGGIDEMGIPSPQVIHPLRVALTGRMVGPGLFETMAAMGKAKVLSRLKAIIAKEH